MPLPDDQNIPGLEHTNYVTGASNLAPTPAATVTPPPVPVATPTPTPALFQDKSMTFEQRMARNQLPAPSPIPEALISPSPSAVPALLEHAAQLEKSQPALQYKSPNG